MSESGGSVTLTVTRTGGTGVPVTVQYASTNGTAIAGSDYTAVSGTLSFSATDTSLTIPIPITSDALYEGDETFTVSLSSAAGAALGSPASILVTITDDDTQPALSVSNTSVVERNSGTTTMTFTVSLSAPSGQQVTVDYTTADGTATSGSDYGARFGTLTFAPGETTKSVAITVNGDVVAEADETVQLLLSSPANASIAVGTGTGTITNDDGDPAIAIADTTMIEGNSGTSNATLVVSLSNPSSSTVTVDWATSPNTASSGTDFTTSSGSLSFAPGETSKTIDVPVSGDTVVEGNESFFVNLSNPANASIGDAQGVATIVDDDGSPALTISDLAAGEAAGTATLTVLLVPASQQTVTVDWTTVNGTASGTTDFTAANGTLTFNPGETSKTIPIAILDDSVTESTEAFEVALSAAVNAATADGNATVTIIDDDPTPTITVGDMTVIEGAAASFVVSLSNASASTVTVAYATSNGTAIGADYAGTSGVLTFNPGETTKTVNVATTQDALQEPDETFAFLLSGATNATITRAEGTAGITDDDGTPAVIIGDATIVEGNAGATMAAFLVTVAGNATQTITVDYATADGSGVAGSDYATATGHLLFPPGTTAQTVEVPVIGDLNVESDETFFVNLSNATNASVSDNQALGTITNDDTAPIVPTISIGNASVVEGNAGTASMTFTVTLSSATTTMVTVDYTTANVSAAAGSDYAAASGTLLFAPGVTARTFTVAVAGDTNVEGNETFVVNLSNPSNGTILVPQATGTILDDDTAPVVPSISIGDANAIEGNSGTVAMTFNVTLSAATTASVTVDFATANGSAIAGSDYAAGSGTLIFAPGVTSQNVIVAVAGDTNVEGNETFVVNLTNASNGTLLDAQGTGTIVDDDTPPVVPSISIGDANAIEGNSGTVAMTFNVTLSAATTATVTVDFATANGSAIAGSDYAAAGGTLIFAPGVTSQNVIVAVAGDTNVEGNETLVVNLTNASNGTLLDAQGTGTIVDDDSAPVAPSISIGNVIIDEGDSGSRNANFRVTLSGASASTVSVHYATANGTATAGSDYAAASGSVVFAPGVTSQTLTVAVLGDMVAEPDETFTVHLSNAVNATIADAQGRATIRDDDQLPAISIVDADVREAAGVATFSVTLGAPSLQTVFVSYATHDESATAGADYEAANGTLVFTPGQTSQSIEVSIVDDVVLESDETFDVILSNPQGATLADDAAVGTIHDDDGGVAAVLVIGGSGAGNLGSQFRTVLQMHNPSGVPASGNLIVRPMGGGTARTFPYALDPHETRDITASIDVSGFITADLVRLSGDLPRTSVRVFNDAGPDGRNGFTATLVPVSSAITAGRRSILIAPDDIGATRFNIGVRALSAGAHVVFTLRRANGTVVATTTRELGADVLMQFPAASLFDTALANNDAIEITVTTGAAFVYGSSVDNVTQDPSFTVAEPLP